MGNKEFLEKYPSLKKKIYSNPNPNMDMAEDDGYGDWVHVDDIEENLVDKETVKKIIEEIFEEKRTWASTKRKIKLLARFKI